MLLSLQPAWTRVLPKPGAWMEVLKQLTAVPLFATAIWLAYVYGRLYAGGATDPGDGVYRLALLLGCFLTLAVAGWVLGRWPAKWGSAAVAVLLIAVGLAIPLIPAEGHESRVAAVLADDSRCRAQVRQPCVHRLHRSLVPELPGQREAGAPRRRCAEAAKTIAHVILLRADWTKYDPEITKELASLGRSGVPTYVLYPASQAASPDVLSEVLTKDLVLDAIKRDAGGR